MTELNLAETQLAAFPNIPAGTTKLDASDNALTEVPASIGGATELEELLLYKNKIKTVDKAIGECKKLTTLNLFNNQIMKAPPEIGALCGIEELNIAANKLMMLADAHFSGLASCKILTLNDNRLVRMGSLEPLQNLEELRLYGNNLEEMPPMGKKPNLTRVEIHKNRIGSVPDAFFTDAPALEVFQINGNMLKTLPSTICDCAALKNVQLQKNKLEFLPESAWPSKIEALFMQENPDLKVLPAGLESISSLSRCNVGEAGPDSLVEKIKGLCLEKKGNGKFWGADGKCFDA